MKQFFVFLGVLACSLALAESEVNLHVSRNVAPAQRIRLNITTKNVPTIRLEVRRLDPLSYFSTYAESEKRPPADGRVIQTIPVTVIRPGQRPNAPPSDTYYSKQINLPPIPPGLYLISSPESKRSTNWAVVNVTHLAVIVKRSSARTLAWVTDFKTGAVVTGAEVGLYGSRGQTISKARTGSDGTCLMPAAPGDHTLIVRRGADVAGLPASVESQDGKLIAHFQTDRPIYRPGQTASYKVSLRYRNGQTYKVRPAEVVEVSVRDNKDTLIHSSKETASPLGTIAGEVEIPAEGATGPYTLVLQSGKQTAYQTFTVAAYRKPEFKVDAKPASGRALAGESVQFSVDASYYFGAPVAQAEVRYTVRRSNLNWGGWADEGGFYSGDGNLYPRDTYASDSVVASETAYTDNRGRLVINVRTDPNAPDSNYRLEATVTDGTRRQVQADSVVPVYAASIRMRLDSNMLCVPLGRLIPIDVRITDLDGRPTGSDVTLQLIESVWREKVGKYESRVLATAKGHVPTNGALSMSLPAKSVGSLEIRATAKDRTGRVTRAALWTYVVDAGARAVREREAPRVTARLDKRVYAIGQSVQAFIQTNRPAGKPESKNRPLATPVLVVTEGRDIFGYRVLAGRGGTEAYGFKAESAHAPNAYLDVSQWVDGQLISSTVIVPVPDPQRRLTIDVTADKETYRPGDKATYHVTARTSDGKGTMAEVALSVVDEAIYALQADSTADAYQTYWGRQANEVVSSESAPEMFSGGAYQRVSSVAPVRQRFEDTAYWNARVLTDASGYGTVTFEMPGNLTRWRATARAIDADTRVGIGTSSVIATRPVTLRLAAPRQFVVGDHLQIIATVNNRTARSRSMDVELLGTPGSKKRLEVPANGEGRVEFEIAADKLGKRDITAQAVDVETGEAEFSDALQVTIPVVPDAVAERVVRSLRVSGEVNSELVLPNDLVSGVGQVRVAVFPGNRALAEDLARRILKSPRYGTAAAVAHILAATTLPANQTTREVREALALLSRTSKSTGWGWWEDDRDDPFLTAAVLRALVRVQEKWGIDKKFIDQAAGAAQYLYQQTNLWEHRAVLASALVLAKHPKGAPFLNEVLERGQNLSPYAKLRLAEVAVPGVRTRLLAEVNALLSEGPVESYLPVGEGIGWRATEIETNALLLQLSAGEVADRIAEFVLSRAESGWVVADAECAVALHQHSAGAAASLGSPAILFNGRTVPLVRSIAGGHLEAVLAADFLKSGSNAVTAKAGEGILRLVFDATVYRPVASENERGIRIVRRFEIQNAAGIWHEVQGDVPPGVPVRVTSVIWGDAIPDAVRVVQPLPAGFEYLESDYSMSPGRSEVRDGAVVSYVQTTGTPIALRYFMRAESTGQVRALPAWVEVLRRPERRGNTSPALFKVLTTAGN